MSRPYFSVKHVETMSLLPAKLTRGRAYFVDDEQVIVIDHGLGPVTYGGKPGVQGVPGEPLPVIQAQIDSLSEASLKLQRYLWEESARTREQDTRIEGLLTESQEYLQYQIDQAANAIITLSGIIREQFEHYDAGIATLAKTISEMYPAETGPKGGEGYGDPLDNETLTTEAGTWTIQQTVLKDGMIELVLDAQELRIETLKAGDTVSYDGSSWEVTSKSEQDGLITITLENY